VAGLHFHDWRKLLTALHFGEETLCGFRRQNASRAVDSPNLADAPSPWGASMAQP
jgi:hypothetical protein